MPPDTKTQYQSQVQAKQLEMNKVAAQKILARLSQSLTARTVSTIQVGPSKTTIFV